MSVFVYNNPIRMKKGGVLTATLRLKNEKDKLVDPADTPVWTSSNTSIATVSAAGNGKTATITASSSNFGEAVISVTTNSGNLGLNPGNIHNLRVQVVDSTLEGVDGTAVAGYVEPGVVT